jgi:hypothetical protein
MIISLYLIGKGQIGRVEDPGLGTEELEQPSRFLDAQSRVGAVTKRAVKQQEPGWRVAGPEA